MIPNCVLWEGVYGFQPESIAHVRHQIRTALDEAGFEADAVDTAVLLACELATNAVQHGRGRARRCFEARAVAAATGVYVEVADGNQRMPLPRRARDGDENGRGLRLLAVLGHKWGVTLESGSGKRTWVLVAAALPEELRTTSQAAHRQEELACA
ncbi:ATP-binding protein [Streptacidiphilus albus]|uniref:ATP-binding protein n=1 Tax=Streptacidiphilus albus TaxID=105425 RepID=UPI00068F8044|nr:ATP-binding protein [Streptacidiphilus albus]